MKKIIKLAKLTQKRKEKGLSQTEVAKLIGVSNKSISRYERGERNPDLTILSKLAEVLNCQIGDLI